MGQWLTNIEYCSTRIFQCTQPREDRPHLWRRSPAKSSENGSGPYTFTPFIDSNAGSVLSVPFGSNPVGTTIIFPTTADWTQITSFKWKAPDAGIGSMSIDNLKFATMLTPIPEPASALLLATGFAAVNLASRRRRKGPRQNSNPRP